MGASGERIPRLSHPLAPDAALLSFFYKMRGQNKVYFQNPPNLSDPCKHQHGLRPLCCPKSLSLSLGPPGRETLARGISLEWEQG